MEDTPQNNRNKATSLTKKVIFAFLNGIVLIILTIGGASIEYGLGSEGAVMRYLNVVHAFGGRERYSSKDGDDFLPVNVGFDRELVGVKDEYGIPAGKRAVIDRRLLADFLDSIEGAPYKSLILDIRFYKEDSGNADSALFAAINRLPRLYVASNPDEDAVETIDRDKIAATEYAVSIVDNNFLKYKFESEQGPGMALAVYNQTENDSLRLTGKIPWVKGHFATSSLYLPITYNPEEFYDAAGNKQVYNLGADIMEVYSREELAAIADGKIVVVGDYIGGDRHETYTGNVNGPVILMNGIIALKRGDHLFNWWCIIIMTVIYTLIVLMLIEDPAKLLPWGLGKSKVWKFITMFVSYSAILTTMNIAIYRFTGVIYDIFLPGIYLAIFYFIIENTTKKKWQR